MLKRLGMAVISGALLLTAGCLQKETSHTLYLRRTGRSRGWRRRPMSTRTRRTPGKRIEEEQRYIGPALLGAHGVARGLAALGPQSAGADDDPSR